MELEQFLEKVRSGERVDFAETQSVIDGVYDYTPVGFSNGLGEERIDNEAGVNEGSCRIFAFAKLNRLGKDATLHLFGDYYWKDVLQNPDQDSHRNIRTFMKYGWDGIRFSGSALTPRSPA